MKRIISLLLCLCMMAGLLCGCRAEDPESYVPTGDALVMEAEEVVKKVTTDGTQSFSLAYYPEKGLDPIQCTDYTNRVLFPLMYQGLFSVNRDNEVVPILCESCTVSPDLRTYTITINPKATFSDGSPVTAEDAASSLHEAWRSDYYGGRFFQVASIYAADTKTLVVGMNQACGDLPRLLDIPIVKRQENVEIPLGSGPYVLGGTEAMRYLVRRSNWWCSSNDLLVTADRIPLEKAETVVDVRDYFEFDDVGIVCTDPGSDRYTEYRCDYELWDCETGIFVYLGFNLYSSLFQNVSARQAVLKGIDRQKLSDSYYRGFAFPAELPASPNSPYYSASLAQKYAYNQTEYLSLAAASGASGKSIRLLVNSDDSLRVRVAQEIGNMLNAGGLIVTVDARPTNDFRYALSVGDYDIYLAQTKLSPNMDLSHFFSENGALSYGGLANVSNYTLCLKMLENEGNAYTFYQTIMDEALLCPILFRGYAVYAARGLMTDLSPARDNLFFYTIQ